MRKIINEISVQHKNIADAAFIKRVMWLDLEERIRKIFDELEPLAKSNHLGTVYLRSNYEMDRKKIDKKNATRTSITNSIYIFTTTRQLSVLKTFGENAFEWATDQDSQLWFTQGPSGDICIFMSPYKSSLHKADENNIWIGYYKSPIHISSKIIEKHISTFFVYGLLTTGLRTPSRLSHFRLKMIALADRRFRLIAKGKFYSYLEKTIIPIAIGLAGIIATLFAAGKI